MIGKKKTNQEFVEELKSVHGNEITPLEKYINIDKKIKFRCNKCSYEWYTIPYSLLIGRGCPCCASKVLVPEINSLYVLRPDVLKYLKNQEDAKKFTVKNGERIDCRCPDCGYEKSIKVYSLTSYPFHCDFCSDKISMPNKFTANILRALNIPFELEKTFKWGKNKRYDVYIENYNGKRIIIENNGIQHKEGGFANIGGRTLKEEQINDTLKETLANLNGIDIYINVDYYIRHNSLDNFKDVIINSDINNIFDLGNIDWNNVWEETKNSLILKTWELWNTMNKEIRTTTSVGKIMGLSRYTVANYLKQGVEIGKIEYNPLEEQKSFKGKCGDKHPNSKKVVCLNTGEVFESINLAKNKYNVSIKYCCDKRIKHAGVINGEKLVWSYYDDYVKLTDEEKMDIIKNVNNKIIYYKEYTKVICLNNNEVFESINDACEKYNIKTKDNLKQSCVNNKNNIYTSCGKVGNDKLIWFFYDDYINLSKDEINKIFKEVNKEIKGNNHYKSKKIICVNAKKIFNCQREAGEYYGIKFYANIGECCRNKRNYCGTLENGEKLRWMYLEDYDKICKNVI